MRIVVFPNSLDLGGSQLNAVELGEQLHQRGHHIVVFGPPGVLARRVEHAGMVYEPAPARPRVRPSPAVMRALGSVVERHDIDLVHGHEWPPILEACYGPGIRQGVAVVGTVMSMGVAPFIPKHLPLVVGTRQIVDAEQGRDDVHLIEPPVDIDLNRPGLGLADARQGLPVGPDDLLLVVVSRLANELKLEGLLDAAAAVGELVENGQMVHLAIVGDGPARPVVEDAVAAANSRAGRQVVTLVGSVEDPRPWYDAADIALGMGGSALRAMAFAKPLVVQGEQGFWRMLTPESLDIFLYQGWYGIGDGGEGSLVVILRRLLENPALRRDLGDFARRVVVDRYALGMAADVQEEIYRRALRSKPPLRHVVPRLARPVSQVLAYEFRRRFDRIRGQAAEDDFNAITALARPTVGRTL